MSFDSYTSPESEALLRSAQERFDANGQTRRTLITELVGAVGFVVCACAIAALAPSDRMLSLTAVLVSAAVFLATQRVVFPVAAGFTRPSQLAFVPMLFLLPLRIVPALVAALWLLDMAPDIIRGRASAAKVAGRVADSWYTVGPVAVLLVFGDHSFGWQHWPLYLLAFIAQMVIDLGSGLARMWFAERILPSEQTQAAWTYATDFGLSCIGLLTAASAADKPALLLLALPMIGLLGLFARERQERMDNTLELSSAYRGTALLLGDVVEDDDQYTGVHSKAVVDLSVAVAAKLGLDATARRNVEFGALLHDIGKIRVPKDIIHKPGKLTPEEWEVMRQHTIFGEEMLQRIGGTLAGVGRVVRYSHEHYDGNGYPDGLVGDQIPIESRVVAVCDAFNAMTTDRSYRKAMSIEGAVSELRRCSGSQFDPVVVDVLLDVVLGERRNSGPEADLADAGVLYPGFTPDQLGYQNEHADHRHPSPFA